MEQTSAPAPTTVARRLMLRLPTWPSGPKPRRRTELGLLVFASLLTVAFYVIAEVGAKGKMPPHVGPILGVILGIALAAHVANRWLVPGASAVVLPLAALLNGVGYVVIVRWDPPAAKAQATWAFLGILLYVATLLLVQHSRDLDRYRYLLLFVTGGLLLAPLAPGLGTTIYGARLFVHFGPVQFQPIELAKVLLVIFFASYLAEKKELLSIPTARLGDRLVLDPRPLVPILVVWGASMLIIGLENDIGFAALLFTVFVVLLWISTGRWAYLVLSVLMFAAGAVAVAHVFPHVDQRITAWLHPTPTGQLGQSSFALAHGGIGGAGLGQDNAAGTIPFITSDMIFAAIADEMGFIGASAVVIAFVLFVGAGLRIAQTARSDFSRLVATGLIAIIGFQSFFIMSGVVRMLPLTGITLPFVAYGGSSLVANYVLVALLMRVSQEGSLSATEAATGVRLPGETGFVDAS